MPHPYKLEIIQIMIFLSVETFSHVNKLLLHFTFFILSSNVYSQVSFKDSLDNKLDVSDWVVTYDGFIPVPMLITEPALGYFGGALGLVFIDLNTPYRDTVDGKEILTHCSVHNSKSSSVKGSKSL